ncbi:MAG TPA: hypothetical protein VEP66_08025 [Myxococcales bacterium]|nr:hypothetical protein [Myxococcales bacterium]
MLVALTLACGSDGTDPDGVGKNTYTLALVGGADVRLHPGEERILLVLLAQDEVGPVANGRVRFSFGTGTDSGGTRIDAADVITDEDGIARVRLTAGPRPSSSPLGLIASAPGLSAAPARFEISVVPERRLLQIVPTAATRASADGASGSTLAGIFSSVALRVREMDADTLVPVAGDEVSFALPEAAGSRWSNTSGRVATVRTGAGGEARAFLVTSDAAEGPWQVVVRAAGAPAPVTFTVTVQGGGACATNAQCPPGQVCAGSPPGCADDPDPPPRSACDPAAPACSAGQCCDEDARVCRAACAMSCGAGTHCEAGEICGAGSCVPDEVVPDLSGLWLTRHDFNLRETVPPGVREIIVAVRLIDQTLLGKLTIPGLPSWLQDILNTFVSRLLQQYLPEWTQQLIHVSDDLFTVLSHLRSEGRMRLTRNGDATRLQGKEVWTSLVFYWLPLCNGDISGDPGEPPECARIDVVTSDADGSDETAQCKGELLPSIRVRVSPITARVVNAGQRHALEVDRRQVSLQMDKVILILFDQILAQITGGEVRCIEEAALCPPGGGSCMVDCAGMARDVEDATDGILDSGTLHELCGRGVRAWADLAVQALGRAWPITADTLDFSGSAAISGQADDEVCHQGSVPGTCAGRLEAGQWTGDFFFQLLQRQPGTWAAWRPE